jgi:two-component system cell cycle response regulator DivK
VLSHEKPYNEGVTMTDPAKILYVEDNADNRLLIRRILMAEGYEVLEAESALAALRTVNIQIPDLILVDINMPDMDGYTLTMRLREMPLMGRVPIIALTANVMKGDRERTLEAGCDGYIQKPIDVDQFTFQINHYLKEVGRVQ